MCGNHETSAGLSFLEFDVNVFKTILPIQRFFNLTNTCKNEDLNLTLVAATTS